MPGRLPRSGRQPVIVTGNDWVLLLVLVSPGTLSIVAVRVAEPAGGELVSVTEQLAELPGVITGTTFWPLALPTVTLQTTLCSVLAPLSMKFSVNVGAGFPAIVLPLLCSCAPLKLTVFSSEPCGSGPAALEPEPEVGPADTP